MLTRSSETQGCRLLPRNVAAGRRRTSVKLDPVLWDALQYIAGQQGFTLNQIVTEIDRGRGRRGLTQAIRVYIVESLWRCAAAPPVHRDRPGTRGCTDGIPGNRRHLN
jgi:predicted DNA-binding ribbon-helix-helix protein